MARVTMFCPVCGEELVNNGYDYDTARIFFECKDCGWEGNDSQALTFEEAQKLQDEDDTEWDEDA